LSSGDRDWTRLRINPNDQEITLLWRDGKSRGRGWDFVAVTETMTAAR
jgi:hypothetical protein